jgi:enterochelin esterase-like enzyme
MSPEELYDDRVNSLLLPPRPVSVWLPPSYYYGGERRRRRRHAVLYVHDGQNAIDDATSWTGYSWRLAGALTRLAERNLLKPALATTTGVDPLPIVVLLPSAEGDLLLPGVRRRHLEYGDPTQPIAQAHADFVANNVMPAINDRFRTVADDPAAACAIGTSLGGQASLHLLLRHPDKFGGAACLSPAFSAGAVAAVLQSSGAKTLGTKTIYLDNGGDHDRTKVPWFDWRDHVTVRHWWNPGYFWLDTQLQPGIDATRVALDVAGANYAYRKFAGARHNERAWAGRIHNPLLHLLGRKDLDTAATNAV